MDRLICSISFATFTALIEPQDRIMGLGLPDGGHLTHGFYTAKRKISASSIYFQSFPYNINPQSKLIDYDYLEQTAKVFKPRILICGASAYPRDWDYSRLRKIADDQGAYLMMDVSLLDLSFSCGEAGELNLKPMNCNIDGAHLWTCGRTSTKQPI
jgi:glycine hydroxymethyltransferase